MPLAVHKPKMHYIEQFNPAHRPLIMAKKNVVLATTAIVALVALLFYVYRDAFIRHPIQISHTFRLRMVMARRLPANLRANTPLIPTFVLGKEYQLTSVQLIRVDELKTKGFAHPLWELVADSKSYPTRDFLYGHRIPGMHPKVEEMEPEPLVTNVPYRLLLKAGGISGQHDFTISSQDAAVPGAQ
jgi:hypothetical protein